ncbi:MAG: aminotransferase DegT [Porticoccaceae bacterium]|nr:aminotransferase DegT [Porticoccaceae bacterium]
MLKLQDLCIENTSTLMDALKAIDLNGEGILFVQKDRVFYGTLTDGDIRRALIAGASQHEILDLYCNKNALTLPIFCSDSEIQRNLMKHQISMIPLLNSEGFVVDFAAKSRLNRLPIMEPSLKGREKEFVNDCIDSNWISSQGAYVDRFESELSEFCGGRCLATSSGTTALHLAMQALEIGEGDEVIAPNLTFGASINSILHAGATPVLVDVSENDWNICPKSIVRAIGPSTKAIMVVHLYGTPCQISEIMAIASEYKLLIIDDCAEALGAKLYGRPVGSFGDAAAFSFFANKVITCGEGGALVLRENAHLEKAKMMRDHGMSPSKRYWHEFVGYNYRMTNIQAAIGCAQLEKFGEFVSNRSKIWSQYESRLLPSGYFKKQFVRSDADQCYWLFTLQLVPALVRFRDMICDQLRLAGIDTRPMFYPMSVMPAFEKNTKKVKDLNTSINLSKAGFSFPSSISLSQDEIDMIAEHTIKVIDDLILEYKVEIEID